MKEPHGNLVGTVIQEVNEYIRQHELRAGDMVPSESALAQRMGVSRGVVREGYRKLTAIGILDIANGRRARVGYIDQQYLALLINHAIEIEKVSIQQTLDVRRTLELRAAALAALRRTTEEAEQIRQHAGAMRTAFGDIEAMTQHDIDFHDAIAHASRNSLYHQIISSFSVVMEKTAPIGFYSRPTQQARMQVVENHEAIAQAISAQDVHTAEQAMAAHFDSTSKALLDAGIG